MQNLSRSWLKIGNLVFDGCRGFDRDACRLLKTCRENAPTLTNLKSFQFEKKLYICSK